MKDLFELKYLSIALLVLMPLYIGVGFLIILTSDAPFPLEKLMSIIEKFTWMIFLTFFYLGLTWFMVKLPKRRA